MQAVCEKQCLKVREQAGNSDESCALLNEKFERAQWYMNWRLIFQVHKETYYSVLLVTEKTYSCSYIRRLSLPADYFVTSSELLKCACLSSFNLYLIISPKYTSYLAQHYRQCHYLHLERTHRNRRCIDINKIFVRYNI